MASLPSSEVQQLRIWLSSPSEDVLSPWKALGPGKGGLNFITWRVGFSPVCALTPACFPTSFPACSLLAPIQSST